MISQPIKSPAGHIHFTDTNGETYCGNRYIDGNTYLIVQSGTQIPDEVVRDERLCGICWCVWLSIKTESVKA